MSYIVVERFLMVFEAFTSANDVPDNAMIPANTNPAVSAFFISVTSPFGNN